MVTAELAVAALAALALLLMMLWGVYLVVMQLRCIDTATAVARQAARGDQSGVRLARASAPDGAVVQISTRVDIVTVSVRLRAKPLARTFPGVPLSARAQVNHEPGTDR